jgi:hypothetical protein
MSRLQVLVCWIGVLVLPCSSHGQAGSSDAVCLGFAFGTWKPKLDWAAAGHGAFPDSSRLSHAPSGRDWAFGPDNTDTAFVLMPSWWPAGVVILLPNRQPAPEDTVTGEAIAMRAIADSLSPRTRVRAWRVPCEREHSAATAATTSTNESVAACSTDIAATFAWWIGQWSYAVPHYDPGTSNVTASNGGCTLAESFVDRTGGQQHTTIQYDAVAHTWKRHVVDPSRTYDSAGNFARDGSIVFYETTVERETYRPTDRDHVHFIGESSKDGGKTWIVTFDATYSRQP